MGSQHSFSAVESIPFLWALPQYLCYSSLSTKTKLNIDWLFYEPGFSSIACLVLSHSPPLRLHCALISKWIVSQDKTCQSQLLQNTWSYTEIYLTSQTKTCTTQEDDSTFCKHFMEILIIFILCGFFYTAHYVQFTSLVIAKKKIALRKLRFYV